MDISDFILNTKEKEPNPIIQKSTDSVKYDAIAAKLCEKRYLLEHSLKDENIPLLVREENTLEITRLKDSMRAFGVTEIDYVAYLTYKEKEGGIQLELF